jgi:hypothetical protein
MTTVKPVKLPDGRVVLMEADNEVDVADITAYSGPVAEDPGGLRSRNWGDTASEKVQDLAGTLESVATYIPDVVRRAAGATVDKLTLKFAIKIAGETGLPYLAKGSAQGNIEIVMECSFPEDTDR